MIDFGFAFNTANFSDRVLHVEIVSSSDECLHLKSDRKRKGEDLDKENGDEVVVGNDSESSKVVKVTTLHICSAILAANSPYFYKLFKNGMRESHQRHFTLRINPSEEASLMDLLNFIYGNTISATTAPDLLDVLVVADKFEVASCVRFCSWSLQKLPMSLESALLYLELPSSVLMDEAVKPLTDAAKAYLSPFYELKEEAMALPLSTLEAFVRSDDVQVNLEDDVFDFIQKWGHAHYPNPEEYREILNKRLVGFIRFPYMSCWKLKEVLVCPDLDHEQVSKLVREALFFKAGLPCTTLVANPRLVERVYKYRPIKVVQFQLPIWPRCVVYFDLKKDECVNLFPSKRLCSQSFHLGGNCFFLKAKCDMDLSTSSYHFGLFVYMSEGNRYKACTLDYEFEVKKKPFEDQYQSKYKVSDCIFTKGDFVGKHNLFEIPWPDFISEDNDYFINEILHLRAELTLKDSTPLKY